MDSFNTLTLTDALHRCIHRGDLFARPISISCSASVPNKHHFPACFMMHSHKLQLNIGTRFPKSAVTELYYRKMYPKISGSAKWTK